MNRSQLRTLLVVVGVAAFGVLMYVVGWNAGSHTVAADPQPSTLKQQSRFTGLALGSASSTAAAPAQSPAPFQEVIPLPQPDDQQGRGQGEDCQPIILFYYQGRLYQLMPGPQNRPGLPGSPPEFFPLRPYQGPAIPGLPFGPQMPQVQPRLAPPPVQPVQPRF